MKKVLLIAMLITVIAGCRQAGTVRTNVEQGVKVRTSTVQSVKNERSFGYSGTAEASQVIPLSFKTTGTVDKIYVEVGDAVKRGQVLATLDASDMQSIYNTMLAKYRQAEDAYNRLKLVYDQGSLSEIKWVEMKSNYEQAKSSLDLAKSNLEKCNLLAPVDGIVGRRNIEPGQSSISLTLAPIELVKIESILVKISVPENEINKIRDGQKARISVSALDGKEFEGTVSHISPVADMMSRTYAVKITVNNAGHDLKPGMVCDVGLRFATDVRILVVPKKAVGKDHAGNTYVYVVSPDQKTVRKQLVTVGRYHESGIEITGGLTEGQVIVSEGCDKLSDNSSITL